MERRRKEEEWRKEKERRGAKREKRPGGGNKTKNDDGNRHLTFLARVLTLVAARATSLTELAGATVLMRLTALARAGVFWALGALVVLAELCVRAVMLKLRSARRVCITPSREE